MDIVDANDLGPMFCDISVAVFIRVTCEEPRIHQQFVDNHIEGGQ
jgi:hypothetical protein